MAAVVRGLLQNACRDACVFWRRVFWRRMCSDSFFNLCKLYQASKRTFPGKLCILKQFSKLENNPSFYVCFFRLFTGRFKENDNVSLNGVSEQQSEHLKSDKMVFKSKEVNKIILPF